GPKLSVELLEPQRDLPIEYKQVETLADHLSRAWEMASCVSDQVVIDHAGSGPCTKRLPGTDCLPLAPRLKHCSPDAGDVWLHLSKDTTPILGLQHLQVRLPWWLDYAPPFPRTQSFYSC